MSRGIALPFSRTFGTRWGWGVSSTPGPPLPPGKTRHPLYRRLGGSQGRSGRTKNLVPTGIRSRTVQPVAQSLYRLSYQAHCCQIQINFNFLDRFSKIHSISNFMKILPLEAELFHADRRTADSCSTRTDGQLIVVPRGQTDS